MRLREGVEGKLNVAGWRSGALLFVAGDKAQSGDILVAAPDRIINDLTRILIFTLADAIAVNGRYLIANVKIFEERIVVEWPCGQHPGWPAQQVLLVLVVRVDQQLGARSDARPLRALLLLTEIRIDGLELNLINKLHV